MAFSDAFAQDVQDHVNNVSAMTVPATKSLKLYTVMPNAAGTGGTEVSVAGYSAQTLTMATAWDAAGASDQGTTQNAAEISFGTASADGGTVVGWALWDGAQMDEYGTFSTSRQILNGDEIKIAAGDLVRKFA